MQTHERHANHVIWYILGAIILGGALVSIGTMWWQYHQVPEEPITWLGGTVQAVTDNTLTLDTKTTTTLVSFSSTTPIRYQRGTTSPAQLVGKLVSINGVRNTDGMFVATYIRVLSGPAPRTLRE